MAAFAFPIEMELTTATPGYTALREDAAWYDASARGKIRMTGEDRARLLHAMCTNNIQALQPGEGCYALFLNAQGRILADVNVLCLEDSLLLDTEPETRTKVYEHLDRYIIADDVTLEDVTEQYRTLAIEGPQAEEALKSLTGVAFVFRNATGILAGLPAGASDPPLPEATPEEARIVRIERGIPRYGEEITERYLVQEAELLRAVSFHKGCYLGQEIVERVRSRGLVHRHLRPVEIEGEVPPEPGVKLTSGDADAAEIASAVYSPARGAIAALAYVRTAFAAPGTELRLNGAIARVQAPA